MRNSNSLTFCAYRWMVGFSVGAKLRFVLRLNDTELAASRCAGESKASSSRTQMLNRLRAGCSNDRLRESLHFPAADASARPDGVVNRSTASGAFRLCRGEWARCDTRPHLLHRRSWSETENDTGWRPGHHTVSSGLTGDKKSGRRGGPEFL